MLRRSHNSTTAIASSSDAQPRFGFLPLQNELKVLAKRWKIVVLCALLATVIGVYVAAAIPDQYWSRVQMIVDNRTFHLGQKDAVFSDSSVTDSIMENQIEILRSEAVALKVIDRLGLASDPEFVPQEPGILKQVAAWLGLTPADEVLDQRRAALSSFSRALVVRRLGASHIIEVGFNSLEPAKSADIANEVARVYLERQISDNSEAARTASAWLRARLQTAGPSTKVLTLASVPTDKSGLSDAAIVAGFGLLGTGFGLALAFAAQATDMRIRTPETAASVLEANCFGSLPRVPDRAGKDARSLLYHSAFFPGSDFAHVLHHARLGAESFYPTATVRTIGVTSGSGRAGTTTIAANLACVCAQSTSGRILLIDANPYMPSLTKSLAPNAATGLIDVLDGRALLGDAALPDHKLKVDFLPLAASGRRGNVGLIWTSAMKHVIDEALVSYETVIVDLPPIAPSADVRAATQFIDVLLLAVAYDTNASTLKGDLASLDSVLGKFCGCILNCGVTA